MKKALVIFIALVLVTDVFATDIVADLDPESSKSTTGSGTWGESLVELDGDLKLSFDDKISDLVPPLDIAELIIDNVQLNLNPTYLGIKTDAFYKDSAVDYGSDMTYDEGYNLAKALNYKQDSTIKSGNIITPLALILFVLLK